MSLTPNFSVAQNFSTPTVMTLVDTSTGSDVTITSRRVYLQKSDGTYLVPSGTTTNYIVWSYAQSSINIDVLNKDYALSILVEWLNSGDSVVESKQGTYRFGLNADFFAYSLAEKIATTPLIESDSVFLKNAYLLDNLIEFSKKAIEYGGNVQAAQSALDKAKYLIDNADFNF